MIGQREDLSRAIGSENDDGYRHRSPPPILRLRTKSLWDRKAKRYAAVANTCLTVQKAIERYANPLLFLLPPARDLFDKFEDRLHVGVLGVGNIEILLSRNKPA